MPYETASRRGAPIDRSPNGGELSRGHGRGGAMAKLLFWDVDTQYDFMRADGKLYVPDSEGIIPNLKRLTDFAHARGIRIVASADDHVVGHRELSSQPDFKETFPEHCMRGTKGQA